MLAPGGIGGHVAIEVHVERADLDDGVSVLYRDYGQRVRMMFDPRKITEPLALVTLTMFVPRLSGAMSIHRR
jgi:hypothetical protein